MNLTRWIIIGITVLIIAIDVFLLLHYGSKATISSQLVAWSHQYPIIAFAFGFLMAHFFGVAENQ